MKKFVILMCLIFCTLAKAQTFQTAKITGYIPSSWQGKEVILVQIEGNVSGGCNTTSRFAIDSSQLHFKSVRAAIMAAFASQTLIIAAYTQTCNMFPNAWDLAYVCVGSIPC
jgi:hypothetical protein